MGKAKGRTRAASIDDVARLAGVSPQTVSRVSRGSDKVRPETKAKVLQAMQQLGYSPNHAARALRSGSLKLIGVLTQQIERTGESYTTSGVLQAASKLGYAVIVSQVKHPEADEVHDALMRLSQQPIDALIIVQSGKATFQHLGLPTGLPVASSDSALVGYYPSASADQIQGVRDAITHLLELGHKTVHHITGPADSQSAAIRLAAWHRRLEESGIRPPEPIPGGWNPIDGYQAGLKLAQNPEVTAVFCANDEVALGFIRAMHEQGRKVPDDVSVIGFDGLPLGEYSFPPLTTIRQNFHRAGEAMIDLIAEQLAGGPRDGSRHIVIPTELVIRESTAPPKNT
ncbi:LacI family DNA-binding transcriptional regulator [Corynebacterium freiburgense]|uniref:LacI family DNA-binding transcriptional regulator n=1 Tax=Corynebacterium freiburgense TaxID=556548 RepID=UPI0003F5CCC0|nr:LacI family DNA-binding transcriptional regulator [Corynebacterium freiburgense]WJZ02399.1 Lactose operon repressor [Corynebacterium freiburgense]